jgi:hypothetical protein
MGRLEKLGAWGEIIIGLMPRVKKFDGNALITCERKHFNLNNLTLGFMNYEILDLSLSLISSLPSPPNGNPSRQTASAQMKLVERRRRRRNWVGFNWNFTPVLT